jgi:hypothetical protein
MRTYQLAMAVRVRGLMTLTAPLLGKQEHDVEAQAPFGATAGTVPIFARAELQVERLAADLQDLAGEQPEQHGPLMRLPIVNRFGLQRHPEAILAIMGQKRLRKDLSHVRPVAFAGERPQVIGQNLIRPRPRLA